MQQNNYFSSALSDFTYDAASGGAIRHLTDLGYTAKQISEKLTYPTPYERVRETVWKQLTDTGKVLTEEPGSGKVGKKAEYTMERDRYGRTSFRLTAAREDSAMIRLRESSYSVHREGSLAVWLAGKCEKNGEDSSYISCEFGIWIRKEPERFREAMQVLHERQQEYVTGLAWENKVCYHRLDQRMREITVKLYESGLYQGTCYFLKTQEKMLLS